MADNRCKYENCKEPAITPKSKFCIFHAPTEEKGAAKNVINKRIEAKINNGDYNFRGYIFPNNIEFGRKEKNKIQGYVFDASVDFSHAIFEGDVDFTDVQFKGNENVDGTQGDLNPLLNCVRFIDTTFKKRAIFHGTIFYRYSDFSDTEFISKADFGGAIFLNKALFHSTQFGGNTHFVGNQVYEGLDFIDIKFRETSTFYFGAPNGPKKRNNKNNFITINFNHVLFNAFNTYFEKIPIPFKSYKKIKEEFVNVILTFRYCQLKDVYFTDNNMSLFSFYKSSFDQARFISSKWDPQNDRILFFPFKRKNVIAEERFFKDIRNHEGDKKYVENLKSNCKIEDLNGYEDISSLYRQMKTALDNTKDYQEASKFYFNEFEMKRRALKEELKDRRWPRRLFSRISLYNIYKTFAGYGEKPLWSFWWFGLGVLGFTTLNYCLGFKKGIILEGGTIDPLDATFWDSFVFTLYRIIPANYLPYKQIYDIPDNFWGMLIPFLNTAVLILFIAFIAIGLKRHFRRF